MKLEQVEIGTFEAVVMKSGEENRGSSWGCLKFQKVDSHHWNRDFFSYVHFGRYSKAAGQISSEHSLANRGFGYCDLLVRRSKRR